MKQLRDQGLLLDIAKRIKELREGKGLTQEEVYIDTQIHIARIETARVNISVSTLKALCDYFDITLSDFFKNPK